MDEEFIKLPKKWDASSIGKFMVWIGPTSSIFDFMTFAFMYFVFCPHFVSHGVTYNNLASHFSGDELNRIRVTYVAMFQAGWFVESMWSQSLVIHMIRTMKLPFIQSRASAPLTMLNFFGIIVITIIPFTLLGKAIGFVSLPLSFFLYLIPCVLAYMLLVTAVKKAYIRYHKEWL